MTLADRYARLVRAIGAAATRQLIAEMGGERITVPTAGELERILRDQAVIDALATDSYAAVAQRFGISERHAQRIGKRPPLPERVVPS